MRSEDHPPCHQGLASLPSSHTHMHTFYKSPDPVQPLLRDWGSQVQSAGPPIPNPPQAIFKSTTFKTENGKCTVLYILFK